MAQHPYESADLAQAGPIVEAALRELKERDAVRRLWSKDPALWKPDPSQQTEIVDRLGWLVLPETMRAEVSGLQAFAEEMRAEGVRHVVLCGMGGSSLAPEVFRLTFGSAEGYPQLIVLDSTDPGAVRAVDETIDPTRTQFLISSKSGGTLEVMSFLAHFWERAHRRGERFCAITDPGTSLEKLARERQFRRVFLNPEDIGGRYSALSLFGLLPAALIGMDLTRLLERAGSQAEASRDEDPTANPGAWLGAFIGGLARAGRDKMTLLASPRVASFGLWVEQLLAESTGKEGKGIIPIVEEPVGELSSYGTDRCFAVLRVDGDDNAEIDRAVGLLRGRQPLVVLRLHDIHDLSAEMYRWEVATALGGALLGINAFDQPNVQESKDNTARVLREAQGTGDVPGAPIELLIEATDAAGIESFLAQTRSGDYVAIQAYVPPTEISERRLESLRALVRDYLQVATTLGFGPRFLHSTGQLHKGGPPSGVFLQLTHRPPMDEPIPGQPFSFGELIAAQALGDLQSLNGRGLRVARVELGDDVAMGLHRLERAIAAFPRGV